MTAIEPAETERRREAMREAWPQGKIMLLADVALADIPRARQAWAEWRDQSNLDDTPWVEIRALAAAADRVTEIDPQFPELGRVRGFKRFFFMNGQQTFALARPMLEQLVAAGVEVMLLKGVARIAGGGAAVSQRFVGDVDVLVRPEQRELAWSVARERGWHLSKAMGPMSGPDWAGHALTSHALEFSPSPQVDRTVIDLHHYSRSLCRYPHDDDGMWQRAVPAQFLGLPVSLPSPTDQLRHSATHALMHAGNGRAIDWIHDCLALLRDHPIDWDVLVRDSLDSATHGFVGAALLLLKERAGAPIPEEVLRPLVDALVPPYQAELEFRTKAYYRSFDLPQLHGDVLAAAELRAERALARDEQPAPPPRGWRIAKLAAKGMALQPGDSVAIAVPADLRAGEDMWLEVRFRADGDDVRGRLAIVGPMTLIKTWRMTDMLPGSRRRASGRARIPTTLLRVTGARFVGIKLRGGPAISELSAVWVRSRRLRTVWRRIADAIDRLRLS